MRTKLLTIILLIGLNASAQEYLSGFLYTTEVAEEAGLRSRNDVLKLPFFDDFTESNVAPDICKWQNKSVLVNSGFPLFPTNYNAATFDALDATGKVYAHASSSPFMADSLISNPISLKDLNPADSVYFSFYYQPQGNGDAPETNDSLVLMFGYRSDSIMIWNHQWSSPGMTLDSFLIENDNQYFKQILIPVTKEEYFENELVILFYNYASIPSTMYPNDRSNVDNWNIDFVYMDKNRSCDDVFYPLVTFSEKSPSLLRRYQSMPYRQYVNNPTVSIATEYQMFISNLDSIEHNTQYLCHIENISSDWTYDYEGSWLNTEKGITEIEATPKNFLFDMNDKVDVASYLITHIINVKDDNYDVKGDTLYGRQDFYDYYAYDDGTPERGYGVVPGGACFASQFSISMYDTLCGVYLLFNRTFNDANYDFFDIIVWNDDNGKPGNEIYRLKNQRPVWSDTIYKFAYYPFDKVLKVNGTIYVGIMQQAKESINIGFDTSKDNSQYNFFDVGYGWENSAMPGSLMIRPVLGDDYVVEEEMSLTKNRLGLYPNPSKNEISISELDAEFCKEILIFDMTGRVMKHFNNDVRFDVSDLPNGLYMMRVVTEEGRRYTEKFMISK